MASPFDAEDIAGFWSDELGVERGLFTPTAGGAGIACDVLFDQLEGQTGGQLEGIGLGAARRIARLRRDQVGTPRRGDKLAVGGETFAVQSRSQDDAGDWIVGLTGGAP